MAKEILMPKLGLTMKTGTVLKWFKEVGDPVAEKEPVLEIETEKLSHQIEAPVSGVLIKKLAVIGEKYPVSCVLGYLGAEGEEIGAGCSGGTVPDHNAPAADRDGLSAGSGPTETERVFISPVAKKLAASLNIDFRQISGTGPNGRIEKADVESFAAAPSPAKTDVPGSADGEASITPDVADTVIPYTGMRRVIGEKMLTSWLNAPMVTHHVTADVTDLAEYRAKLNKGAEASDRISVNDLMLKFTAATLTKMPIVNSTLTGEGVMLNKRVHLGMATAVPNGLVVPVIRDADRKGLLEISREAKALAARARDGTLGFDEMSGGTFTVSNLGGYGSVDYFTPIINPPQAAILGIGRVAEAAVPVAGEIKIRAVMGLSFTYDHRIIDGATAAEFMALFLKLLENPERSVLT